LERSDWIIIVTGQAGGAPLTPVQLQKSLFVIRELVPSVQEAQDFYAFEPYNYGPFCADIYRDAEDLQSRGYIAITLSSAGGWREYSATAEGQSRARELQAELPKEDGAYIEEIVRWIRGLSFPQLLRAIYQNWPDYKANSIFVAQAP